MTPDPRLIRMPVKPGLWRVDRANDVYNFPPPVDSLDLTGSGPVKHGARWDDVDGRFATVKYSNSAVGAIGRTLARFRGRVDENGGTLIERMHRFVSHAEPDNGLPAVPRPNRVPRDYFDDAYLVRLTHNEDVRFIDLEHPLTHALLEELVGHDLRRFGVSVIDRTIVRNRDRRVTRLVITELREFVQRRSHQYGEVGGVRYARAKDPGWDAYIIWEDAPLELSDVQQLRALTHSDPDVKRAAKQLKLDWP